MLPNVLYKKSRSLCDITNTNVTAELPAQARGKSEKLHRVASKTGDSNTVLSHGQLSPVQTEHVNLCVNAVADDVGASPQESAVFSLSQSPGHVAQAQTRSASPTRMPGTIICDQPDCSTPAVSTEANAHILLKEVQPSNSPGLAEIPRLSDQSTTALSAGLPCHSSTVQTQSITQHSLNNAMPTNQAAAHPSASGLTPAGAARPSGQHCSAVVDPATLSIGGKLDYIIAAISDIQSRQGQLLRHLGLSLSSQDDLDVGVDISLPVDTEDDMNRMAEELSDSAKRRQLVVIYLI
jgi:hypothetical protein